MHVLSPAIKEAVQRLFTFREFYELYRELEIVMTRQVCVAGIIPMHAMGN